jgi:Omp85 superfamily domain
MSRVRAPLALLLLLSTVVASPVLAQDSGVPSPTLAADAGVGDGTTPSQGTTLETEHKHLLEYTLVPTTGPSCVSSAECAKKLQYGEVCVDGACREYEDDTDLFTLLHMTNAGKVTPKPFELLPAILPVIGFNPALGAVIGVTAFLGMYLGDPETTTISTAQPTFMYTTKNQIIFQMVSTIMTADNAWELQGDYRFLIYNQDTYGLGTGVTPVSSGINIGGLGQTAAVPGAQPMDYDLLRFHQSVLKKLVGSFFLGGALRFDRYYNINDQLLNLTSNPPVITSSYAYSRYYGFNSNQYNIVSLGLEALFDSRDSTINPYRGVYANAVFRGNPTWLGSSQNSTQLYGEFRTYFGLDPAIPRNLIAIWLIAQGVTSGALPYMALPAIGWDSRGRTGRGYVAGRFRGTQEFYGEAEFRFRLTDDGFLGGVVFANVETFARPAVTTTGYSDTGEHLFQNLRPAGGVGLRFMMNRASRTNVTLDFAFSQTGFGIYLGGGEAF